LGRESVEQALGDCECFDHHCPALHRAPVCDVVPNRGDADVFLLVAEIE